MGGSRDSGTGFTLVGVSRHNCLPDVYSVLCILLNKTSSFLPSFHCLARQKDAYLLCVVCTCVCACVRACVCVHASVRVYISVNCYMIKFTNAELAIDCILGKDKKHICETSFFFPYCGTIIEFILQTMILNYFCGTNRP